MKDTNLIQQIKQCQLCANQLPLPPNPIIQFHPKAKIQIIGQAPGLATYKLQQAFKDKSGERLRDWLGVSDDEFYNPNSFAITPMAFCYPGKNKSGSGDAPPPTVCYRTWHGKLKTELSNCKIRILIGSHAAKAYLPDYSDLESAISKQLFSNDIVLPHPSPRNNIWLKKHPWFIENSLTIIRRRIREILESTVE